MEAELRNLVIAHRGFHGSGVPENSLAAFQKAVAKGYPIELDVQMLKDGTLIVFHDDNLKRMTGVDRQVSDMTWAEVKTLTLLETEERIPLFSEVLSLVDGRVILDIEIKVHRHIGILEEKLAILLDQYRGIFFVKSFSPFIVRWFLKHRPQYIRGLLSCGFRDKQMNYIEKVLLRNLLLTFLAKPHFIAYQLGKDTFRTKRYRRKGIAIFLWTITTLDEFAEAQTMGDSYLVEQILEEM